ncbi:MAG TPA: DNA methyltransferase [Candidatus Syntrophosphaera sp.]|nr:DNA methyltransferase [Candidatus Syntrophosphaera sp.]
MNTLYYGDNLDILKDYIASESIDLVYLDPPFQSGKNYNIIFRPEKQGVKGATSQIKTFEDTWNWGQEAEFEYTMLITGSLTKEPPPQKLIDLMKAMRSYLDACPLMAYLCMMAPRLLELRRVLKPSGSIYLHCDPTASHYLKLLLDAVFGADRFVSEIIWKRIDAKGNVQKKYGWIHDVILFYAKTKDWTWNQPFADYDQDYLDGFYNKFDSDGRRYRLDNITAPMSRASKGQVYAWKGYNLSPSRCFVYNQEKMEQLDKEGRIHYSESGYPSYIRYLDEMEGNKCPDIWTDIKIAPKEERMGYPTQKPEALLERIIKASSNEGDVVLDPFCGCGTAVAVAEKLNRSWVGIDITYLSIDVIKKRFEKNGIALGKDFEIKGVPRDFHSASKLAESSPFQFEVWAVSQLNAMPTPKSGDKGVDGVINYLDNSRGDRIGKGIISVKGGKAINPGMVRDLKGTLESQGAEFGIMITLVEPTPGMVEEAAKSGYYTYHISEANQIRIPRIQLLTVEHLFLPQIPVMMPPYMFDPYKKPDIKKASTDQQEIEF